MSKSTDDTTAVGRDCGTGGQTENQNKGNNLVEFLTRRQSFYMGTVPGETVDGV